MKPFVCLFLGHTTNDIHWMYESLRKELGKFTYEKCDRCGEKHALHTFVQFKELEDNLKERNT